MEVDSKLYPNCARGYEYAIEVVSGKIPNSIYIVGACSRFLSDLEEKKFPFDWERAERFLRVSQQQKHVKGNWNTVNVFFEPWQCWLFMNIIGFINPETGKIRFRTAYLEVPRGNGKSILVSIASLFFLALDNPKGNEISCFASKQDQARIVLDSSRAMAKGNKSFLKATGVKVLAHQIKHEKSNSVMKARSSDHGSTDGLNDVLSVIDETHAIDRELYDVISSGMSKRNDSLLLSISTAGFSVDGIGHDLSVYAKKVSRCEIVDDTFFGAVYTVDEGDDIFEEKTWRKANPNYGVSVDPVTFKAKAEKAKTVPSDLPNFKTKHLNMWLSEAKAFFEMGKWDLCKDSTLKLEDFKGKTCVVAVDMASKIDLASVVLVFEEKGTYSFFDMSYIPEETVRAARSTLYENCIGEGHLIQTPGDAIQYDRIKKDVIELSKNYRITDLNFDPWNATQLGQDLIKERINCVEFRMTTANLSEPTKTLDALIRQGKIRHNGSPLMRFCFSNVVCKEDAAGNVFPKKSHEKLKIDIAIASIMAIATHIQNKKKASVYEGRGLRVL